MGNYEQLKQSVSDVIKTNGNQEITGSILQNVLLTIISSVGANATFAGVATPTTNPGTPDGPVFWIAANDGVYSNFNGIEIKGLVGILSNKNGNWEKNDINIPNIDKTNRFGFSVFGVPIFTSGGIDASTGNNGNNPDRVRTDDFYRVDYNLTSDVNIIAYLYDNQKTYLGYVSPMRNQTSEQALLTYPTAKYVKFSLTGTSYNIYGYAVGIDDVNTLRNDINTLKGKDEEIKQQTFGVPIFTSGGIDASTGNNGDNPDRVRTDDFYRVDYNLTSDVNIIAYLYDNQKTYLGYVSPMRNQTSEQALLTYPTAKYVKFSLTGTSYNIYGYAVGIDDVNTLRNDINTLKGKDEEIKQQTFGVPIFTSGGIDASTGNNGDNPNRVRTDDFYRVDYNLKTDDLSSAIIAYLYDRNKSYLGFKPASSMQTSEQALLTYPTAEYVKFSLTVKDKNVVGYVVSVENINNLSNYIKDLNKKNENILYGKKWAYCGDSFSAGGYSMSEKTENDIMPPGSIYAGKNKVYGYIIADRNNMIIQDFAAGGRTIATPADGSFTNCFSLLYQNIDSDVDYITLYFGINDNHHAPQETAGDGEDNTGEIPIGTIDDDTINTFCGAYNVILEYLLQNYPFAHIGIIVSNGCGTPEYAEKTIQIAKKWGIPYIDLNEAPAMIRSQSSIVSATAKNIVNLKQRISSTNQHPNTSAHIYESTFIENFLRSI